MKCRWIQTNKTKAKNPRKGKNLEYTLTGLNREYMHAVEAFPNRHRNRIDLRDGTNTSLFTVRYYSYIHSSPYSLTCICHRARYIPHLYCLAVQAGFYSDAVEWWILTQSARVRSPVIYHLHFFHLLHLAPTVGPD